MVREKHFIQIKTQDKDFSVVAFVCDRVCHILVESWHFQGPIVAGTGSHSLYLFLLGSQLLSYTPVKSDMNTKLIKKWEFKKKKKKSFLKAAILITGLGKRTQRIKSSFGL